MNENILQQKLFLWFTNKYCRSIIGNPPRTNENRCAILSIPNDSINAIETKRKKNTGLLVGASDLVLLLPNKNTIFVEVKHGKNKQSPNQIDFQNRVEKLGFQYWLVYSLEQFQELCRINAHLLTGASY